GPGPGRAPGLADPRGDRRARRPVRGPRLPAPLRAGPDPGAGSPIAPRALGGLDPCGPAAAGRRSAPTGGPRGRCQEAAPRSGPPRDRRGGRADGRLPDRVGQLGPAGDVDAARPGPAQCPGRLHRRRGGRAGPFAHVVVDEAQELTDAQWAMILRRCPSRSLTLVGDRAQATAGFTESWRQRLERNGLDRIEHATLSINYRTPVEIMEHAAP